MDWKTHGFANVPAACFGSGYGPAVRTYNSTEIAAERSLMCVPFSGLVGSSQHLDAQDLRILVSPTDAAP